MSSNFLSILSPKCGKKYSKPKLVSSPRSLKKEMRKLGLVSPSPTKKNLKRPASPQKTPKKEQENNFEFQPKIFLRCHSQKNDPQDYKTQVWAASFEPDCSNDKRTTDLVATCGGNIVCFINCRTGHVLKRYKSDLPSENLYTLDWTVLSVNGNDSLKTGVVATGGHEKKIYLIHPSQLKCYLNFKAHASDINCLKFHPSEKTWLFSGSLDKFIHIWDIGSLLLPSYKTSHKKLMTFEMQSEVVQLAICSEHSCLFASSSIGLKVWSIDDQPETWSKEQAVNLLIPESCTSRDTKLVDGLSLLSPHYLGLKVSHSGKVFISRISGIFEKGKLKKKKSYQLPATAVYLWSDSNSDYNYLKSSLSGDIMACGDNAGTLWVYDTKKYSSGKCFEDSEEELQLPSMMLQWPYLKFEAGDMLVRSSVIVNSVTFNWNGEYLVACTDSNILCLWEKKNL